jgi:hypothetical protein
LAAAKATLKKYETDYKIVPKTPRDYNPNGPAIFSSEQSRKEQIVREKNYVAAMQKKCNELKANPELTLLFTTDRPGRGQDGHIIRGTGKIGDWGIPYNAVGMIVKRVDGQTRITIKQPDGMRANERDIDALYVLDRNIKGAIGKSAAIPGVYVVKEKGVVDGKDALFLQSLEYKPEEITGKK